MKHSFSKQKAKLTYSTIIQTPSYNKMALLTIVPLNVSFCFVFNICWTDMYAV